MAARERADALVGLACRREAVASCGLDGSRITLGDLLWWELDGRRAGGLKAGRGEALICANYAQILGSILQGQEPEDAAAAVARKRLCGYHRALFRGVRGRDERPGRIRDLEIWLGPPGSTPASAHYVPPASEGLAGHLDRLQEFARSDPDLPPLCQAVLLSYQLETIHPFVDGSGRVSRLALMGILHGLHGSWPRLLCPSVVLAGDVAGHFHHLQRVRRHGDWEGWIAHSAGQLRDAAGAAVELLERTESRLREHEAQVVRELPHLRGPAVRLLGHLASRPLTAVTEVAQLCGRTFANANALVARLESMGLLVEITGRRRNRRYVYAPHAEAFS